MLPGTTQVLTATASGAGCPSDPRVNLFDDTGDQIGTNDDGAGTTAVMTKQLTLDAELAKDFAKVKDARLDLQVHKVEVQGDRATAYFFYSAAYLLDTASGDWKRESDDKSMTFERVGADWKVSSGF